MAPNPIIGAKLEFLATTLAGVATSHAAGQMDDAEALTAVQDVLDTFVAPVTDGQPETAQASAG